MQKILYVCNVLFFSVLNVRCVPDSKWHFLHKSHLKEHTHMLDLNGYKSEFIISEKNGNLRLKCVTSFLRCFIRGEPSLMLLVPSVFPAVTSWMSAVKKASTVWFWSQTEIEIKSIQENNEINRKNIQTNQSSNQQVFFSSTERRICCTLNK